MSILHMITLKLRDLKNFPKKTSSGSSGAQIQILVVSKSHEQFSKEVYTHGLSLRHRITVLLIS